MSGLRVEWLPAYGQAQREQLYGREENPFESDGRLTFRDKDDHVALLDAESRAAALVGLTAAWVRVGGERLHVAGVGAVIVRADRRGQGLAGRLIEVAAARAAGDGFAWALLFCWPSRVPVYARSGFTVIHDPVTVDQPGDRTALASPMQTMWRALDAGREWPAGPVRLEGLPF